MTLLLLQMTGIELLLVQRLDVLVLELLVAQRLNLLLLRLDLLGRTRHHRSQRRCRRRSGRPLDQSGTLLLVLLLRVVVVVMA